MATALTILAASSAMATAETDPRSLGADARIKQYVFSRDTVYRLDLAMKFITALEFDAGERSSRC